MRYSTPGQITMEKTPNYFENPNGAERIYKFNTSIKLILIVRDPTKKVVSEYVHHRAFHRYVLICPVTVK